ncbi:MAG: peptidase domain-containing ABC transporter [Flavobacteriales bacterium]
MDKTVKPMERFWRIIKAERQEVRSIYIYAIFQGLVNLSLPLGIQSIINFLQAGSLSTSWYVLVMFVLAGILLAGVLQIRQLTVTETIEQRLFANVAFHFAQRVPRFKHESTEGRYIPEVLNRFFEVTTIQKGISKTLLDFSAAIIQVTFGLLLLSLYNPMFVILGGLLVITLYIIFKLTGPIGLKTSMEESNYKFEVAHWLQEVGRSLNTFKLSGSGELPLKKTDEQTTNYLIARNNHFSILKRQYWALIIFKVVLAASLIILGSVLVIRREINIGQFVAAEIVVLLIISSIEKIVLNMSVVYDVLTSLDKLGSVADIKTEREDGITIPEDKNTNGLSIVVRNLTFSFPNQNQPVLNDVSFEIRSGETVCIKGEDGSGKTTLLKMLSGFYENFGGSISFNNLPIGNLRLEALRKMMGENFSEQEIFKGTVAENISCGRTDIELADIMQSAEQAGLAAFIQAMPQGYNTMLEPAGQSLPGSVKRKLILARCFAGNPKLLLIEDTAIGRGAEEREAFFSLLFHHCKDITTIIVTNDEEVAKRCSTVYTMNKGIITKLS